MAAGQRPATLHIAVSQKITAVITDYTQGHFDRSMDRLPGQLAVITASLDKVQASLAMQTALQRKIQEFAWRWTTSPAMCGLPITKARC